METVLVVVGAAVGLALAVAVIRQILPVLVLALAVIGGYVVVERWGPAIVKAARGSGVVSQAKAAAGKLRPLAESKMPDLVQPREAAAPAGGQP